MEAHDTKPDGALTHRRIARLGHAIRCGVDELLQHVIQEAHHVRDETRMVLPLEPGLEVQRGKAADRGAVLAMLISPRGQGDL